MGEQDIDKTLAHTFNQTGATAVAEKPVETGEETKEVLDDTKEVTDTDKEADLKEKKSEASKETDQEKESDTKSKKDTDKFEKSISKMQASFQRQVTAEKGELADSHAQEMEALRSESRNVIDLLTKTLSKTDGFEQDSEVAKQLEEYRKSLGEEDVKRKEKKATEKANRDAKNLADTIELVMSEAGVEITKENRDTWEGFYGKGRINEIWVDVAKIIKKANTGDPKLSADEREKIVEDIRKEEAKKARKAAGLDIEDVSEGSRNSTNKAEQQEKLNRDRQAGKLTDSEYIEKSNQIKL